MQHCLSIPQNSNANVKHHLPHLPCCLPPQFPRLSPPFAQLRPQLHRPVLADSPKALGVLPMICPVTPGPHFAPATLGGGSYSIAGLWEMSPSSEICEEAVYCDPTRTSCTPGGVWDAQGSRITTEAAVSAKHPNASCVWMPACCHWHREGDRVGRGRRKLLGKRKEFLARMRQLLTKE